MAVTVKIFVSVYRVGADPVGLTAVGSIIIAGPRLRPLMRKRWQ